MKFFFTHLRSALNVRDFLGAVRFVNTATAFNLRNVDNGPTFAITARRVLRRADVFIDAEYPIRVPFFNGPMRFRIIDKTRKLTMTTKAEAAAGSEAEAVSVRAQSEQVSA